MLLPDPALRAKVLPLHFRLSMAHLSDGPMLLLDACAATELNGQVVQGKAPVLHDDLISISDDTDSGPLLCFRLNSALS